MTGENIQQGHHESSDTTGTIPRADQPIESAVPHTDNPFIDFLDRGDRPAEGGPISPEFSDFANFPTAQEIVDARFNFDDWFKKHSEEIRTDLLEGDSYLGVDIDKRGVYKIKEAFEGKGYTVTVFTDHNDQVNGRVRILVPSNLK